MRMNLENLEKESALIISVFMCCLTVFAVSMNGITIRSEVVLKGDMGLNHRTGAPLEIRHKTDPYGFKIDHDGKVRVSLIQGY